jgi:hypothetical protein
MFERSSLDNLNDPVLVTAFGSQLKGGQTAPSALAYALTHWKARLVHEFEPDGYYIDAHMRPWVRRDGERTVIDWPNNVVYRVDAPERTLLILVGVEPSLNWRGFVAEIGDFAERHNVSLGISLKSVPATVPHTLEAPLKAIYSEPGLQSGVQIPELDDQDGPADIGRVLNLHLVSKGVPTVDIYAMEPFYGAAIPDAEAGLSLLRSLQTAFGLPLDTTQLEERATLQRRAIDAAVDASQQLRETVHALEQRARSAGGTEQALLTAPNVEHELDATEVLGEAENILRSLQSSGDDDTTE